MAKRQNGGVGARPHLAVDLADLVIAQILQPLLHCLDRHRQFSRYVPCAPHSEQFCHRIAFHVDRVVLIAAQAPDPCPFNAVDEEDMALPAGSAAGDGYDGHYALQ